MRVESDVWFLQENLIRIPFCLPNNYSATGDPDTPISEGDDDMGNPQGGNGWYFFFFVMVSLGFSLYFRFNALLYIYLTWF